MKKKTRTLIKQATLELDHNFHTPHVNQPRDKHNDRHNVIQVC